jgi:hypothetical protein
MDRSSVQEAEEKVADLQAALDRAQRVLQATERAQEAAERHADSMRIVAFVALGLVAVALVFRRRHRHSTRS